MDTQDDFNELLRCFKISNNPEKHTFDKYIEFIKNCDDSHLTIVDFIPVRKV